MNYQVKPLDCSYADEVNRLRRSAYSQASGLEVADEGIFWNQSDNQSIVLGIFLDNSLIATMRAEVVTDKKIVEQKMECPWIYNELTFPAMILSKAAVDLKYAGRGFVSILRLLFFKLAREWKVEAVLGTMTESSLRIPNMKNLGYQFFDNKNGWSSSNYKSLEKVKISFLDYKKYGESSIAKLNAKYGNTLECEFKLEVNDISYREVSVVS